MKARLLFADRDADVPDPPEASADLVRDLGLAPVLDAMAAGDSYLRSVAHRVLLAPPLTPQEIEYRQALLSDCLRRPSAVRDLYEITVTATEVKKRVRGWILSDHPSGILSRSVAYLSELVNDLDDLRDYAARHHNSFTSAGLTALVAASEHDLAEPYLLRVRGHLRNLEFTEGAVLNAALGPGCTGRDYTLRKRAVVPRWSWVTPPWSARPGYTYRLPPRDEYGGLTLSRMRDHGVNSVANAAAQSADQVIDFFGRLRLELGFFIACLNLHDALTASGVRTCMPLTAAVHDFALHTVGLVDTGLALRNGQPGTGNTVDADGKRLIVLTGANQGGKSTLLRALGLAQLMADAGVFVTAESYHGSASAGVFTHYRREEDAGLEHGKLDDELARMSQLIDRLRPGAVLLCDESFASTNEREGSEIATGLLDALLAAGVRVYYVTHLYALSHGLARQQRSEHLFLRAHRDADRRRSFRLVPGEPESTSYAADLFQQIFADL